MRGGVPVARAQVDGGATRNDLLCQFQADLCGRSPWCGPTSWSAPRSASPTWPALGVGHLGRARRRRSARGPSTASSNRQMSADRRAELLRRLATPPFGRTLPQPRTPRPPLTHDPVPLVPHERGRHAMTWADPRQLVEAAQAGGYAVGAFNMHNDETAQALVQAAEQADVAGVPPGRAGDHPAHGRAQGLRAHPPRCRRSPAPSWCIHLDHGPWDEVFEAIRLGFDSIMYDGAHLPFEENIKTTRHVVAGGATTSASRSRPSWARSRTPTRRSTGSRTTPTSPRPSASSRRPASTGWPSRSASCTACRRPPRSRWTSSGSRDIRDASPASRWCCTAPPACPTTRSGRRSATGVHKFNADTDLRHAFRAGIEETWAQGDRQLEEALAAGRDRMIDATVAKMRALRLRRQGRPTPRRHGS